ncbi:MAG: hypothetical protein RR444_01900 [Oscillospiraceae bacterium]
MKTILEELYDSYNTFIPDTATQAEVDNAHQALIRSLEKPERKLVLRIIDNKDLIAGARARESFESGFWLAWRLCTQLNMIGNGRLLEQQLNADGRFVMEQEKSEDES